MHIDGQRVNSTWQVLTMEHHSAFKSEETLPQAATRMSPEAATLSEANQTHKKTHTGGSRVVRGP